MSELSSYAFLLRTLISMYIKSIGVDIFMTRTVHEVLWGFKDPLLTKLHSMKPEVDEYFGLMWKVGIVQDPPQESCHTSLAVTKSTSVEACVLVKIEK